MNAFKDGLHSVVIGLRNGIKLVIVASSAIDGQTENALTDRGNQLFQHDFARSQFLNSTCRHGGRVIERPVNEHTRRNDSVSRERFHCVAGDLFSYEFIVWFVGVETVDDVVRDRAMRADAEHRLRIHCFR